MPDARRFSVVTVNFNNLAGLQRTAESLFSQTLQDFEWIVVDAVSRDGSVAYVRSVMDDRTALVSEPDRGLYDGMNKGLDRATGELVIFMNSGDSFASPQVLERVAAMPNLASLDILYGDATEVGAKETMKKRAMPHWLVAYSMFTHHQAIFYRRATVGEIRYDLQFKRVADWAFTATLLNRGARARHMDLMVCDFERGGLSQVPEKINEGKDEMRRFHREVLRLPIWLSNVIVGAKFAVNDIRRAHPRLYDSIRSRF